MSTVGAAITLTKDGASVEFEDEYGKPVRLSPAAEHRMKLKALRKAATEARRNADSAS